MLKQSILEEWDNFVTAIDKSPTIEGVIDLLSTRMNHLGFEKSAYWLRWPNRPESKHIILSTYPKTFVDHYINHDYGAHDMVGRIATNSNRPFAWAEIGTKYEITRQQKIIFHDSESVGLREGASVPIHGPNMTKATFSVSSNLPKDEFEKLFNFHRHEIHILATSAHERLMQLGLGSHAAPLEELSARESEVLLWIARGYTYYEISEKILVQEDTIKKHMQSIFRKLGASNGTHAAAIAIMNGLITP